VRVSIKLIVKTAVNLSFWNISSSPARSTRVCSVINFRYIFILFCVFKGLLKLLIYSIFIQRSLDGKVLLKLGKRLLDVVIFVLYSLSGCFGEV